MNFEQFDYLTGCVSCEEATPLVDLKAIFLKNHLQFDSFDMHLPPAASIFTLNLDWLSCESSFSSLRWFMISNCFKSIRSSRSWSFLTIRYERKFNFNDIEDSLIHITRDPFWFFKRFLASAWRVMTWQWRPQGSDFPEVTNCEMHINCNGKRTKNFRGPFAHPVAQKPLIPFLYNFLTHSLDGSLQEGLNRQFILGKRTSAKILKIFINLGTN